jgi:hypothetical protein
VTPPTPNIPNVNLHFRQNRPVDVDHPIFASVNLHLAKQKKPSRRFDRLQLSSSHHANMAAQQITQGVLE